MIEAPGTPHRDYSYRRQVGNNAHTLSEALRASLPFDRPTLWAPLGIGGKIDFSVTLEVLDDRGLIAQSLELTLSLFQTWSEARYHLVVVLREIGITRYNIEQNEAHLVVS